MKGEGCSDGTIDSVVSIEYWLLLQSIDTNYYSEKSAHPRSVTFFKVTVLIQAFSEVIRSEIIQSLLLNQTVSAFGDLELENDYSGRSKWQRKKHFLYGLRSGAESSGNHQTWIFKFSSMNVLPYSFSLHAYIFSFSTSLFPFPLTPPPAACNVIKYDSRAGQTLGMRSCKPALNRGEQSTWAKALCTTEKEKTYN